MIFPYYIIKWVVLYILWPILKLILFFKYGIWYILGKKVVSAVSSGDPTTVVREVGEGAGLAGGWGWWLFMKLVGKYFSGGGNNQAQANTQRRRR